TGESMSTRPKSEQPDGAAPDLATALIESANRQIELIELLHANQPRKRKTSGDALIEMTRKQFKYPVFQNGIEAQPHGLSDDTLKKVATLAPGRYLSDVVQVVRTGRDSEQRIFLFYDNSTIDKKMMLKSHFTSFSDLIDKIVKEMAARGIAPAS